MRRVDYNGYSLNVVVDRIDLIFLKRDERRDDQDHAFQQETGDLVDGGFPEPVGITTSVSFFAKIRADSRVF